MKELELTKGFICLVSDIDFDYINQWRWYTLESKNKNCSQNFIRNYASRRAWNPEKKKYESKSIHRVILSRMLDIKYDLLPRWIETDHITHFLQEKKIIDNRRHNIRPATHSLNLYNQRLKNNAYGIQFKRGKWYPSIEHHGAHIKGFCGYLTEEDAIQARNIRLSEIINEEEELLWSKIKILHQDQLRKKSSCPYHLKNYLYQIVHLGLDQIEL